MTETPERLSARLRSEGEKTLEFFRALPSDCWETGVYSDGGQWTVRQLLAHFVSAEAGMNELIRVILAGGAGAPEDFDIDLYNQRRVDRLQALSPAELLDQFVERRQASAQMTDGLSAADLTRTGRHPWMGIAPVEDILKLLYRHNQIHQRDIRKALSTE